MGIFGKKPKQPAVPAPLPMPDDTTLDRAARRRAAQARQQSGVAAATSQSQAGQRETLG